MATNGNKPTGQGKGKIPPHKCIPGTGFTVDAFRSGFQLPSVRAYFLSHAHSDHYSGITDRWSAGLIFCSPITANLIQHILGVKSEYLRPLALRTPHHIHGVEVTLIDANHCPGAVIFLFRLPNGKRYIHCGDMRYSAAYLEDPLFQQFRGADAVFLDTTYCKERYTFPPQEVSVQYVAETIGRSLLSRAQTKLKCSSSSSSSRNAKGKADCEEGGAGGPEHHRGIRVESQDSGGNDARMESAGARLQEQQGQQQQEGGHHQGHEQRQGQQQQQQQQDGHTQGQERHQQEGGHRQGHEQRQGQQQQQQQQQQEDGHTQGHEQLQHGHGHLQGHDQQEQLQHDDSPGSGPATPSPKQHAQASHSPPAFQGHAQLFLISTYVIGKEKILLEVHRRTGLRIYADDRKRGVLGCFFSSDELEKVFTGAPEETPIHVTSWGVLGDTWPYFRPNFTNMEELKEQYKAEEVIGFVPTGWMHEISKSMRIKAEAANGNANGSGGSRNSRGGRKGSGSPREEATQGEDEDGAGQQQQHLPPHLDHGFPVRFKGPLLIHLVPYSEHSSYNELVEFVKWLRPKQVVPTVGVEKDTVDNKAAHAMLNHFQSLVDDTDSKALLLKGFAARAASKQQRAVPPPVHPEQEVQEVKDSKETKQDPAAPPSVLPEQELEEPESKRPKLDCPPEAQKTQKGAVEVWAVEDDSEDDQVRKEGSSRKRGDHSGGTTGVPGAQSGIAQQGAVAGGPQFSREVWEVCSVLGDEVTAEEAQLLTQAAKGDASAAINMYYDNRLPQLKRQQQQQQQGQGRQGQQKQGPSQQQTQSQGGSGKQAGQGKRKQASLTGGGMPKKSRQQQQQQGGQRSIASFFKQQPQQQPSQACTATETFDLRTPPPSPPPPAPASGHSGFSQSEEATGQSEGAAASQQLPPPPQQALNAHPLSESPPSHKTDLPASAPPPPRSQAADGLAAPAAAVPTFFQPRRCKPAQGSALPQHDRSLQQHKSQLGQQTSKHTEQDGVCAQEHQVERKEELASKPHAAPPPQVQQQQQQQQQQQLNPGPLFYKEAVLLPVAQYDPVKHACWSEGQVVPYAHLAHTLAACDSTTKRLAIADALTNMFRSLLALGGNQTSTVNDLVAALYLVTGRISPAYEHGGELNIGGSTVSSALGAVTGVSRTKMSEMYNKMGDIGDVAQACRRNQSMLRTPPPLTLQGVLSELRRMSVQTGSGAAQRRKGIVEKLMRSCRTDSETKYLVRTLVQNLRVGANWRSVIGPLARAVVAEREGGARATKAKMDQAAAAAAAAFHVCPCYEVLVRALLQYGPEGLKDKVLLVAGVPAQPMLARVAESVEAALKILGGSGSLLLEHKYDGRRAQIHLLPTGQVKLFSRNMEDCTGAYPDVCNLIRQAAGVQQHSHQQHGQQQLMLHQLPQQQQQQQQQPLELLEAERSVMGDTGGDVDGTQGDTGPAQPTGHRSVQAGSTFGVPPCEEAECAAGPAIANADRPAAGRSLVCDAEIVGVEREPSTGRVVRMRAFQELATRARGSVDASQVTLSVCVYLFDLLCLDGSTTMGKPLSRRRELMQTALPYMREGYIQMAQSTEVTVLPDPSQPSPASKSKTTSTAAGAVSAASMKTRRPRAASAARFEVESGSDEEAADESGSSRVGGDGSESGSEERAAPMPGLSSPSAAKAKSRPTPAASTSHAPALSAPAVSCRAPTAVAPAAAATASRVAARQTPQAAVPATPLPASTEQAAVCQGTAQGYPTPPPQVCVPPSQHIGADKAVAGLSASTVPLCQSLMGAAARAAGSAGSEEADDAQSGGPAQVAHPPSSSAGPRAVSSSTTEPPRLSVEEAEPFVTQLMMEAIDAGTEGLMLKRLDGPYEPSKRSDSWVKLKKDYIQGLQDTLDLVPIGAWYGNGRKVGWFSPFLLACYDPSAETFQSVCRCMSGFTDAFYVDATQRLGARTIPSRKAYYDTSECCDVWFEPTEVWEVRGADLTLSPVHAAARGLVPDTDRGIALRFPRFIKVRDDKAVEQATGPDQLASMYMAQRSVKRA